MSSTGTTRLDANGDGTITLRSEHTNSEPSTEDMIKEIHGWLSEIMPAARVAVKMLNARSALAARWRGGKNAQQ